MSAAHHVGTFVPKDSEVSANFKQIKFSIQAGKFDVALRLFDEGAIHAEMEKIETRLPAGLEDGLRAALKAKDVQGAEVRLMIFMVFVARDLAREAARRLADDTTAPSIRLPQAAKLLEAVWRYHNLVDFVLYQRDVKAALAMRLAFDDAESAVGGGGSDPMKVGGTPAPGSSGVTRTDLKPPGGAPKSAANLVRAKDALRRMTEILTRVIEQPVPSAPALPAGVGVARP
ncbi:MAG: hypothetical protein ACRDY4_07070 [Acidimicrobiia bacterium]